MTYPRFLTPRLMEAFQDTPLLLIKGARQVRKSTLMRELISQLGGQALSFDDPSLLSLAKADPRGFIDQLKTPVLLDEVQRAPEVILPLKLRIDKKQNPGQLFLTGSADFHTLPKSIFLIFTLNPWFSDVDKRLSKTPKVYFYDSGLLAHLLRLSPEWNFSESSRFGQILENFVVCEVLKACSWERERIEAFHFRTQNGEEVDLILQNRRGDFVGVEIKAASTVVAKDFKGLSMFESLVKDKFRKGIILYAGDTVIPFRENLWAVPIQALWE